MNIVKAVRKKVSDIKMLDWKRAKEEFVRLRSSNSLSYANLLPQQKALFTQAREDKKSLNGEPVLIVTNSDGHWFGDYAYPATIVKITEEAGQFIFKCLAHPISEENWEGEKFDSVKLFQLLPLRKFKTTEKAMQELSYQMILTNINASRNKEKKDLQYRKDSLNNSITSLTRDLNKYKKDVKSVEDLIKKKVDNDLTVEELKKSLDNLSRHKKVAWAFLTPDGNLIVETAPLNAISPKTNKENKSKVFGRFAFRIAPGIVEARNLDFQASGYGHPNLGSSICQGAEQQKIISMSRSGDFFELVDFLILFFSLSPHDAGTTFINHTRWWAEKRSTPQPNPWKAFPKLYEVKADPEMANKIIRKKPGAETDDMKSLLKFLDANTMLPPELEIRLRPNTRATRRAENNNNEEVPF